MSKFNNVFRVHFTGLSTWMLFACHIVGVDAEETGTCDAASGVCSMDAGDDMSAIQVRGGSVSGKSLPGQGDYWDLVDAYTLNETLPYSKHSKAYPAGSDLAPWCFQGLFYLDQWCLTYPDMPKSERKRPCLGSALGNWWVNEFVTAFGHWDETTRCFTAERKAWVFGDAKSSASICKGDGIRACQTNKDKYGPCDVGAKYGMKELPGPLKWYFVKTETAWTRQTPLWFPFYSYYPVNPITDAHGVKTHWYQNMLDDAMRDTCSPKDYKKFKGCRHSQWAAQGKIARCLKATP